MSLSCQGRVDAVSDNEVVQQRHAQELTRAGDPSCDVEVLRRRGRIPGRMIMGENQRMRAESNGDSEDLPGVYDGVGVAPSRQDPMRDGTMPSIHVQGVQLLGP